MSKKVSIILAVLLLASVVLGACKPKAGAGFKACQVTDMGGIADKSFNATAWKGVTDAMDQLGIDGVYLESRQETDYTNNINAMLGQDCDLIIPVGYALTDATKAAAEANTEQSFITIDVGYDPIIPNVRGSYYQIDQATYLVGYLAAGMTETGIVGTYGGMDFPSVTAFMDGFWKGVEAYNLANGTSVQVLGWDPATKTGLFSGDFSNTDNGKNVTLALLDEGADIIMPVAGPVGQGTIAAIEERGTGLMIGVDTDWSVLYPESADIILASALKKMDTWILQQIQAKIDGTFEGGQDFGTLENGLVGVAYGTAFIDQIPDALKAELDVLKTEIIAGNIATTN